MRKRGKATETETYNKVSGRVRREWNCVAWWRRVSSEKVFVGTVPAGERVEVRPREREREWMRRRRRRAQVKKEKRHCSDGGGGGRGSERDRDSNKIYYRRKMMALRDKEGPMWH